MLKALLKKIPVLPIFRSVVFQDNSKNIKGKTESSLQNGLEKTTPLRKQFVFFKKMRQGD